MSEEESQLRRFLALSLEAPLLDLHLIKQVQAYATAERQRTPNLLSALDTALPFAETPVKVSTDYDKLSQDQRDAWAKLKKWVHTDQPYFVLRGFAGTGKTFLLKMLISDPATEGKNYIFTAPTNKAKKVMAASLGVQASTTYSALGLKMVETDDGVLTMDFDASTKPYIPKGSILVVDEGSMVNDELKAFVEEAREHNGCKVLYVGDPAQLPPVGQTSSKVWKVTEDRACRAMLREVMRFDNQLLALSIKLRQGLKDKHYRSPVKSDNDENGGVYLLKSQHKFEQAIVRGVNRPEDFNGRKVIAWRNKAVDRYNDLVRDHLGFRDRFCVSDQLMIAAPVDVDGRILASVDDEVVIRRVARRSVKHIDSGLSVPVWQLTVDGDVNLILNIPVDDSDLQSLLSELADQAKKEQGVKRKAAWAKFWSFKRLFHKVRYGWAMTAHRGQGSTYENVFVDQMDILANPDKRTAFKCLYTAFTRPTTRAFTY